MTTRDGHKPEEEVSRFEASRLQAKVKGEAGWQQSEQIRDNGSLQFGLDGGL